MQPGLVDHLSRRVAWKHRRGGRGGLVEPQRLDDCKLHALQHHVHKGTLGGDETVDRRRGRCERLDFLTLLVWSGCLPIHSVNGQTKRHTHTPPPAIQSPSIKPAPLQIPSFGPEKES